MTYGELLYAKDGELSLADEFAEDVRNGLSKTPKALPPRHFYDGLGSILFEAITELPEYYLTRTEEAILEANAAKMVAGALEGAILVELGSGSSRKTRTLIRAMRERGETLVYRPIDISEDAIEVASKALCGEFPGLVVEPVVGRYKPGLVTLRDDPRQKVILFIGSSIGNFDPPAGAALLARVASVMHAGDRLLLGVDMDKARSILEPAYNDALGVSAAFNRNVLLRVNRELAGDFDLHNFRHHAYYNAEAHRMEMHLVARRPATYRIARLDLAVGFEAGESIHTENSYKFTQEMLETLAAEAGLSIEESWYDARRWFGVHRLTRA